MTEVTKELLVNRRLSRRLLLKSAAAAGAANVAGLGALLAACAPQAPQVPVAQAPTVAPTTAAAPKPATAPTTAAAPKPATAPTTAAAPATAVAPTTAKRGGTLNFAVSYWGAENFLLNRSNTMVRTPFAIPYEHLVNYDIDDPKVMTPGLAESWTEVGLKEYTLKIRKGVPWHGDWGEVTAEDIAFTIDLIVREDSRANGTAQWRPLVKYMKVVDPYTITFKLDQFNPDFIYNLGPFSTTLIACKKYVQSVGEDKADREPIGSGPYRFKAFVPGSRMEFEAAEKPHWRVPAKWDKMVFSLMPEGSTRLAMLKTGAADMVEIAPAQIDQARESGFSIIPSMITTMVAFRFGDLLTPDHPQYKGTDKWQDIRVRLAMNLAINREAINKSLFKGLATLNAVAPTQFIPNTGKEPAYPYDPDKAKQLLREARAEGFEFQVMSMADERIPDPIALAEACAAYWEAVGLKPKLTPMDRVAFRNTFWIADKTVNKVWLWGGADTMSYITQDTYYKFYYSKELEFTNVADATLDAIYDELLTMAEPKKRVELLERANKHTMDNHYFVHIGNVPAALFAANPKKVKSWKGNYTGNWVGYQFIEPTL